MSAAKDSRSVGPEEYLLYGMSVSPYSQKVAAAIKFAQPLIPCSMRFMDDPQRDRSDISLQAKFNSKGLALWKRAGTEQVPILITPENWCVADSTPILRLLDSRLPREHPLFYPKDPVSAALSAIMEEFFDEWMCRLCVYFRWMFPESVECIVERFGTVIGMEPLLKAGKRDQVRSVIERTVMKWGKRAIKVMGVSEEHQQKQGEEELLRVCAALDEHLATHKYMFGDLPTAADCAFLGQLIAHYLLDAGPANMLQGERFARLREWVYAVQDPTTAVPHPSPAVAVAASGASHMALSATSAEVPPFLDLMLKEVSSTYARFIRASLQAKEAGEKLLKADIHGGEVTMLVRDYPNHSFKALRAFIQSRLVHQEHQERFNALMRQYNMHDLFGVEVGDVVSRL